MKKIFFSLAAVVMMAVMMVSCGGGNNPKATAEKFLNGLYHMDFAAAKEVSTDATKKQVEAYEQLMGMGGEQAKEEAKKVKIEVKEPVVNGESATAEYTMSNDPTPHTLKMVKQNGKWLAEWSKMDMGGGATESTEPATDMPMTGDTTTGSTMNSGDSAATTTPAVDSPATR